MILVSTCFGQVDKAKKDDMPPLPEKLLAAKTVFLSVDTEWAEGHTKAAYKELKKWGRFTVVGEPEKADLVFVISAKEGPTAYLPVASSATATTTTIGNTTTTYVQGNGGGAIPIHTTHHYLNVIYRETGVSLYKTSTGEQFLKSQEASHLIMNLRKRIEGQ
jgi:hypothetical protein